MTYWDLFVAAMFVLSVAPIAAFVFLHALDERRRKRDNKIADAYEQYNEAHRLYRRWR